MNDESKSRLFFGMEIKCPWPQKLPEARLIDESERHLTMTFLGMQDKDKILALIPQMPKPVFQIGPAGFFDACLFFPPRHARCVAWRVEWLQQKEPFFTFQKELSSFFAEKQIIKNDKREYIPHVTIARPSIDRREWAKTFTPLPVIGCALHLYESLGHSTYRSLYKWPFIEAFEEIEHTADIAFCIRGHSIKELHAHAEIALAFTFAPLLGYFAKEPHVDTLDDVVSDLNSMIAYADAAIGCPFKAVSFHGEIKQLPQNVLEWEMIVDV